MISYEEAVKIAKQYRDDLTICTEMTNAYIFGGVDDDKYDGGEHTPVVIMKEDGAAKMMVWYVFHCPGKKVRKFNL